jgi:hypothetical protein
MKCNLLNLRTPNCQTTHVALGYPPSSILTLLIWQSMYDVDAVRRAFQDVG